MNVETLSKSQLIGIKIPEKLYTNDAVIAKKEYRKLSMRWHPDRGGDDEVFQHIKSLYEVAEDKISKGLWVTPGQLDFSTLDGKRYQILYKKHHKFELGEMYISNTIVVYMIDKINSDLVDNHRSMLKKFKYANDGMKSEFKKYLPEVMMDSETKDHYVVVYKKTSDLLLLRDVIEHYGELPSEHTAWILSSLYNLSCYLKYCGISHNAISMDTYFISPKYHSGALLGGWWYSSEYSKRIIAVPQRTLSHCSDYLNDKKSNDSLIDLQLIKVTGLETLGDPYGSKILMKAKSNPKKFPSSFVSWLRTPPKKPVDAFNEYGTYKSKVLLDSWGPPKFHEMKLTSKDLYA